MKRIILSLLCLSIFAVLQCVSIFASDHETPIYENLLDFRNLRMDDSGLFATTIEDIIIEQGFEYTFVLSFDFLGRNEWKKDDFYIDIFFRPILIYLEQLAIVDVENQRLYVQFHAYGGFFEMPLFPIDELNDCYDVILYKGTYADFDGFIPYLDPNEVMSYQGALAMDYDHRLSINQIKDLVVAKDPYGGIIDVVLESDDFSSSLQKPNQYQIVFSASFMNITKYYYLDIYVFDLTPPTIIIPQQIEVNLSNKISLNSILENILVSDNVDDLSYHDLVVIEDNYTAADDIGEVTVTLEVSDLSGNKTTQILSIILIDVDGPEITGPKAIYLYTTDQPLSNVEILSKFTAHDLVDQHQVTIEITFNQYAQNTTPGIYDLRITAYDTKMNATHKDIKIHVVEHRGPTFETDQMILSISIMDELTEEDIKDWFISQMSTLGFQVTNVSVIHNEYHMSQKKAGTYYVYFSYEMDMQNYLTRTILEVNPEQKQYTVFIYIAIGSVAFIGLSMGIYFKKKKKI